MPCWFRSAIPRRSVRPLALSSLDRPWPILVPVLAVRWLLGAVAALLMAAAPAAAAGPLADLDIVLVLEVEDVTAWLALHEAVLATSRDAPKPLAVGVAGATGGRRSIIVHRPRFETQIFMNTGRSAVRIVVAGTLSGAEALVTLTQFEAAVLAIQAGSVENELLLTYELAVVSAHLFELYISRS
jgi:hypothetical protein